MLSPCRPPVHVIDGDRPSPWPGANFSMFLAHNAVSGDHDASCRGRRPVGYTGRHNRPVQTPTLPDWLVNRFHVHLITLLGSTSPGLF